MRLSLFSVWIAVVVCADYQQSTSILLIEILYKWLIYSTRNSSGSVRYERFCLAYQQRGLCVAEITYGHCVTGTARLEADSGVKQRLISCISITVHCGSRTHRSARAYCFVCCSNKTALKWYCGALVLVFFKYFFIKVTCCVVREAGERSPQTVGSQSSATARIEIIGFLLTAALPVNSLYRVLC